MLGVRLDPVLGRRLAAVARQQRRSKSDVVREALDRYLSYVDLEGEARRQSLLVAGISEEREILDFIGSVADTGGAEWTETGDGTE